MKTSIFEGLTNIDDVQYFLKGLKNTPNSRVFVKVEQIEGYNYLCVYSYNTYPEDDIIDVNEINGLHKTYQLKLNQFELRPQKDEPCLNCKAWDNIRGCKKNMYNSTSMVVFGHCPSVEPNEQKPKL